MKKLNWGLFVLIGAPDHASQGVNRRALGKPMTIAGLPITVLILAILL
jgi:hypothetical protein